MPLLADNLYVGAEPAAAAYLGDTLVWPAETAEDLSTSAMLVADGVWTWFTDPRAVVHVGAHRRMYTGYVTANGSEAVASYDLDTHELRTFTLYSALEVDDHNNPALLVRPDGRVMAFYSKHSKDNLLRIRVTTNPEDITAWGAETTPITNVAGVSGFSYANPFYLSGPDRIYLFSRGAALLPVITYSDDDGATWATCANLFEAIAGARPYVKYASNGVDRIDFWATAGHPRDVAAGACDIYHWYFNATAQTFHKSDGTQTATLAEVAGGAPLGVADVTLVHDASVEGAGGNGNGWTWSIEYDAQGHPVVTYAVYVANDDNRYRYARWDGTQWVKSGDLETGVSSIYGPGAVDEPQYTGGIIVDPRDTNRIFLSRQVSGQWEIERRTTSNGGTSWSAGDAITSGSTVKNFRPYVPRGWVEGAPALLWSSGIYTTYQNYSPGLRGAPAVPLTLFSDAFTGTDATALTAHTPDLGPGWVVYQTFSGLELRNGRASALATTVAYQIANVNMPTGEYAIECDIRVLTVAGNGGGPSARTYTAATTFYHARWNMALARWELYAFVAGTGTLLGTYADVPTVGAVRRARLEVADAEKRLYVDGVLRITSADNSIPLNARPSLRLAGSSSTVGVQIDNVLVETLAA